MLSIVVAVREDNLQFVFVIGFEFMQAHYDLFRLLGFLRASQKRHCLGVTVLGKLARADQRALAVSLGQQYDELAATVASDEIAISEVVFEVNDCLGNRAN